MIRPSKNGHCDIQQDTIRNGGHIHREGIIENRLLLGICCHRERIPGNNVCLHLAFSIVRQVKLGPFKLRKVFAVDKIKEGIYIKVSIQNREGIRGRIVCLMERKQFLIRQVRNGIQSTTRNAAQIAAGEDLPQHVILSHSLVTQCTHHLRVHRPLKRDVLLRIRQLIPICLSHHRMMIAPQEREKDAAQIDIHIHFQLFLRKRGYRKHREGGSGARIHIRRVRPIDHGEKQIRVRILVRSAQSCMFKHMRQPIIRIDRCIKRNGKRAVCILVCNIAKLRACLDMFILIQRGMLHLKLIYCK